MSQQFTRYFLVKGKVQGVGFRANTKKQADALKIHGWVRNREDGSVEVNATGSQAALEAFQAWLRMGPPMAIVEKLDTNELPFEQYADFLIR